MVLLSPGFPLLTPGFFPMPTWSLPGLLFPQYGWAFVSIPVVFLAWVYGRHQRRKVQQLWNDSYALPVTRRLGRWLLLGLLILLSYSLMGPSVGQTSITPTMTARDLFLAIDISQSMLAEDQPPVNRLQRAQTAAQELLHWLPQHKASCRVGLLAFAGSGRILCPPTSDLHHVERVVADLHVESLGMMGRLTDQPANPVGTSFQAVEKVLEQWTISNPEAVPYTEVMVLSDGDDLNAAVVESKLPFRLNAWAVGDGTKAWPIPHASSYLMTTPPSGEAALRVLTQRHAERLQQWVAGTGGTVLVEDGTPRPLVAWWQQQAQQAVRPLQSQARLIPVDSSHWFVGLAGLLLLAESCWGGARIQRW